MPPHDNSLQHQMFFDADGQAPHLEHNNKNLLRSMDIERGSLIEGGSWRVDDEIAAGGFGQILSCRYIGNDARLARTQAAVKLEPTTARILLLSIEINVLNDIENRLSTSPHFLRVFATGTTQYANYVIMQRAGRDIKPSNFCLALPNSGHVVCLDFGLARKYVDPNGRLKVRWQRATVALLQAARPSSGFHGTTRYASPNTHRHLDMGRCDDVWPVFYLLIEMVHGQVCSCSALNSAHDLQLPWRSMSDKVAVLSSKESTNYAALTSLHSLTALYAILRTTHFSSTINLRSIRRSFIEDMPNARQLDAQNANWIDTCVEAHYQVHAQSAAFNVNAHFCSCRDAPCTEPARPHSLPAAGT